MFWMDLSNNLMEGTISDEFSRFSQLFLLSLSNNLLSGTIPLGLTSLAALESLTLDSNALSGTVPDALAQLSLLETLVLANNAFEGTIPASIGNCTFLRLLDLSQNRLSGTIPSSIAQLTRCNEFNVYQNALNGTMPPELGNMSVLARLTLTFNQFSGTVPRELGQAVFLNELDLSNNFFSGSLPLELRHCTGLQHLVVSNNSFTEIFAPLVKMTRLRMIDASHNAINMTDSCQYLEPADLDSLQSFDLSSNPLMVSCDNLFSNCIPTDISLINLNNCSIACPLSDLLRYISSEFSSQVLLLAHNQLSGQISDFSSLVFLNQLDLSDNPISGDCAALFNQRLLSSLNIASTMISGCPTRLLTSLTNLKLLDLRNTRVQDDELFCASLRQSVRPSSSSAVLYPEYNVTCPQWISKATSALLRVDPDFLDFAECNCPLQFFWDTLDETRDSYGTCQPCPAKEGLVCSPSVDQPEHRIVGNYFPVFRSLVPAQPEQIVYATFVRCHFPAACNRFNERNATARRLFADDDYFFMCGEGYRADSFLCSRCEPGYSESTSGCLPCAPGSRVFVPLLTCVIALALYAYLWFLSGRVYSMSRADEREDESPASSTNHLDLTTTETLFIMIFYWQLMSLLARSATEYQVSTASASDQFFDFLQSLASFRPFALDCLDSNADFGTFSRISMVLPLVAPLFTLALGFLIDRLSRQFQLHDAPTPSPLPPLSWKRRAAHITVYLWRILYFPVLGTCLSWFNCERVVDVDGTEWRYLSSAPYITCGTTEHQQMVEFAALMLALFGVFLPVMAWITARRQHQQHRGVRHVFTEPAALESDQQQPLLANAIEAGDVDATDSSFNTEHKATTPRADAIDHNSSNGHGHGHGHRSKTWMLTAFLWAPYVPQLWWFFFVRLVFQVLLQLLQAVLPFFSTLFPILLFFILIFWLVILLSFMPYRHRINSITEIALLLAATLVYLIAIARSRHDYQDQDAATHLVEIIKFIVAIATLAALLSAIWARRRLVQRALKRCRCGRERSLQAV